MNNSSINIPKHWKWVTLDKVSKKITDGSHNPPKGIESGIPMLSAKNVKNNLIDFSDVRYLSEEDFEIENRRTNLEPLDVLLTTVGTIGRTAIVPLQNSHFVLQRSVTVVKPLINPKYLSYFFQTSYFQNQLNENATGTAQKGIYLNILKQLEIPIAPIEEQNRIVEKIEELFSELDKTIEHFEKNLMDVENLWVITLNKAISEKGNSINLGDIVQIKGGKRLPKNSKYAEYKTEYPYVRVSDFKNYSIDESNLKYITQDVYDKLKNYSISSENVYISIAGTIGLVGSIPNYLSNTILTENAAKLIFDNKKLSKNYLIYLLDSPLMKEQINSSIKATSQPKLALYKILEFKIPKYTLEEQKSIVDKLEETKAYCLKLKDSIKDNYLATINLKEKILQDAFQGKLSKKLQSDTPVEFQLKEIENKKEEYLEQQQEIIKNRPKITRMEKEQLSIIQVLEKYKKPISSEQLWEDSIYSDNIEKFYTELKKIQDKIVQKKTEKKTLISLK